jgi:hypothetical protein
MKKNKSLIFVILTIVITFFHVLIAHYLAPSGITFLPLTMVVITIIVFRLTDYKIYIKAIVAIFLYFVLDICLKLYAGGTHDWEGQDWIVAYYSIGLILSLPIIIYYLIKNRELRIINKIAFIILFLILIYVENEFFSKLGVEKRFLIK